MRLQPTFPTHKKQSHPLYYQTPLRSNTLTTDNANRQYGTNLPMPQPKQPPSRQQTKRGSRYWSRANHRYRNLRHTKPTHSHKESHGPHPYHKHNNNTKLHSNHPPRTHKYGTTKHKLYHLLNARTLYPRKRKHTMHPSETTKGGTTLPRQQQCSQLHT